MNILQQVLGSTDALSSLLAYMWDASVEFAQTPEGKDKLGAILRDLEDADTTPESREGGLTPPPINEGLGALKDSEAQLLLLIRENPTLQADLNRVLAVYKARDNGLLSDEDVSQTPLEPAADVLKMANRTRE